MDMKLVEALQLRPGSRVITPKNQAMMVAKAPDFSRVKSAKVNGRWQEYVPVEVYANDFSLHLLSASSLMLTIKK